MSNNLKIDSDNLLNSYLYWNLGKLQNKTINGKISLSWDSYPFNGNVILSII